MIPRISVLISVWNGERYIKQAIDSILNQSFEDFELIIIDDGSTDSTSVILDGIKDSRIVRINNEKNIGLVKSLNKGLKIARGEFIARMDADDVSVIDRFEKQILYLDMHKDVGVLGTAMKQIDTKGKVVSIVSPPERHPLIMWTMLFDTAIIHASVMMKRDVIFDVGGYDENFLHIEDTELWSRLIFKTQFANLPEVLYIRRLHTQSVMNTQSAIQISRGVELRSSLFERLLNKKISNKLVCWFSYPEIYLNKKDKNELINILLELQNIVIKKNPKILLEDINEFQNNLNNKIIQINNGTKNYLIKIIISKLKTFLPAPLRHKIKMSALGNFARKIIK